MALTDQDQNDLNRSLAAEKIIQDPLVVEALALMERATYELWAGGALSPEHREELHRMHQTQARFVSTFESFLQNGAAGRLEIGIAPPEKTFLQRIKEYFHGKKA